MAAMAPALTEAAAQAHIKLPPLSPPASTDLLRDKALGLKAELTGSIGSKVSPDKGLTKSTALPDLPHLEVANGEPGKPSIPSLNLKLVRSLAPTATGPYGSHKLAFPKDRALGSLLEKARLMNRPSLLSPPSLRGHFSTEQSTGKKDPNTPRRPYLNNKLQSNTGRSVGGELMKPSLPVVNNMSSAAFDKICNDGGIASEPGRSVESGLDLHAAQQQVMKFQCFLGKKVNTIMKRLRRIQGKQLEQHIRRQLAGFVSKQHKNLQTMAKSIKSPNSGGSIPGLQTDLLQSEDVRHLSTAALVNLVRKLQSPQPISIGQRLVPNSSKVDLSNSILKLDKETSVESERMACQLNTVLRHMESALDSDATESSSGGESCDEDEQVPTIEEPDASEKEKKSQQMAIHRRAEWKWASDRSAIAFRWTWLQAQVSDLEYRIRQQSEIHKQIRSNKGAVNFDSLTESERLARLCKSRTGKSTEGENKNDVSNINNSFLQTSKSTSPLTNVTPPALEASASLDKSSGETASTKSLNGLIDTHSGNISDSSMNAMSTNLKKNDSEQVLQNSERSSSPAAPVDITCQAARCRPVKSYRKRKILRTTGLHLLSQKSTRLSTVKCHCYAPVVPCAMCGGRYNNTQPLDPDVMPLHERVSLLDPAFHPVLSFSQEIPLPIHFEALLKSGEWQSKPPPKPAKTTANDRRRQKILQQNEARRTSKKLKNAAAVLLSSAKFRSRYDKKPVEKSRPSTSAAINPMSLVAPSASSSLPTTPQNKVTDKRLCRTEIKKRRAAQLAIALKKFPSRSISLGGSRLSGKRRFRSSDQAFFRDGSINFPSATFKEMKEATLRKRRGESAFDINNIVIPYSMAASTRVEKLQYKEIVTPKWRKIVPESPVSEDQAEVESLASSTNSSLLSIKKPPTSNQTNGIIPACQKEGEEEEEAAAAAVVKEEEVNNKEEEIAGDDEEESEIEDLSDELYIQRHAKCETQEKKRFVSFFQHGRRGHRSVRSDDTEPVSPESMGALDNSSMIGSPIHPTPSSSLRHGSCAADTSQSPSPLPALLPLHDRSSSSLHHSSPNNKLHSELTESQSLLMLDETDKMRHGRGLSYHHRAIDLEESDGPFATTSFKQQELASCLRSDGIEEGVSSSHLPSHLGHRSQSPLLSKISQNAAALSTSPSLIQSCSPRPSPIDSSFQPRPLTPTTFHPTTHLQRFCDEQLGRRRCSSLSKHERSFYDDDGDLFDMVEHSAVEPWIPRTFPLTEVEYETMRIEHCNETKKNIETISEALPLELRTPGSSHPCSPLPSSSSASNADEDPNDPEWKVIGSKSGIVLRLAKR